MTVHAHSSPCQEHDADIFACQDQDDGAGSKCVHDVRVVQIRLLISVSPPADLGDLANLMYLGFHVPRPVRGGAGGPGISPAWRGPQARLNRVVNRAQRKEKEAEEKNVHGRSISCTSPCVCVRGISCTSCTGEEI